MAFQTRREPLVDAAIQEAIEKRGRELLGLVLITLGVLSAALLATYSPDDPSWVSATNAPVNNWLGPTGAAIAAPFIMIIGYATWMVPAALITWGGRFVLHWGNDRVLTRIIFFPIAVAVFAIYAATLTPGDAWVQNFGLGGLLGDTVVGALLNILPLGMATGLKALSLISGLGLLVITAFALGFTRYEIIRAGYYLVVGLILTYSQLRNGLAKGARGTVQAASTAAAHRAERREARLQEETVVEDAPGHDQHATAIFRHEYREQPVVEDPAPERGKTGGLRALMNTLAGLSPEEDQTPEPELVDHSFHGDLAEQASGDDRIRAKIAQAIQSRMRQTPETQELDGETPAPEAQSAGLMPSEPPLTRRVAAPVPDSMVDDPEQQPAPLRRLTPQPVPMPDPKKVVQHAAKKAVKPSKRAKAEVQPSLSFEDRTDAFELPPLNLLRNPVSIDRHHLSDEALEENARMLENVLDDYGVKGEIVSVRPGPVVTMYELEPAPGVKASRVIGLSDDIARSMSALSARVSTVPGRSVIGIELPNVNREMVVLREILASRDFGDSNMRLPLALGKDIGGGAIVGNLAKMPHLLIAGTTGSGKSVAINTMILSLLYKLTPEECRMIMIDPKMLELSVYDGIPHLLSPVVTDPKKAVVALKWVVGEMEDRYRKMSKMGVRNIEGYNGRVRDALAKDEMFSRTVQTGFDEETGDPIFETEEFAPEALPYIVVVVDEMADLMMVAGKEIEACIQRLAQMARASGIHLIMATQRPSVDVITGTIKANFPTRISFQVTSKVDSRTILGEQGAEQLLGMGDMLYMAGGAKITRVHGPFCSDEEVEEIVNHLKAFGPPDYVGGVVDGPDDEKSGDIDLVLGLGSNTDSEDALYDTAVAIVIKDRKCSTSYIQRKLAIGYNKAARLVEQMEDQGLVSPANHVGKREILVPEQ
ncbi:MAG: DNA translocase FtsK 4TM domain-containing protein [Paracoccaceae bacterium]|jgi:S-DNA-T family DNA segregation ATPase FtsK/SpoIIIE|nr:DNA translocase FtsK 4TM domain-containing protein [Paracoccaceae bacterium]MDP7186507.1 DNA translocase FtsK 4TM domain-containing protein [Paracoccaceae bacterium]